MQNHNKISQFKWNYILTHAGHISVPQRDNCANVSITGIGSVLVVLLMHSYEHLLKIVAVEVEANFNYCLVD